MFVSFCLEYAHVPEWGVPQSASQQRLLNRMKEKGLYAAREDAEPRPGDLIFFDHELEGEEGHGATDHIGIVLDTDDDYVYTIEGNSNLRVQEKQYELTDEHITGYGLVNLSYELNHEQEENDETTDPTPADNAVIEVLEGSVPADAAVRFGQMSEDEANELVAAWLMEATRDESEPAPARALMARAPQGETEHGSLTGYAAFDIGIDADGEAFKESGRYRVTVLPEGEVNMLADVPEGAEVTDIAYTLYHIHDDRLEMLGVDVNQEEGFVESFTFETEGFSTFVLEYTVEFEIIVTPEGGHELDGQVFDFTLPGGGFVSLERLVEALGLADAMPEEPVADEPAPQDEAEAQPDGAEEQDAAEADEPTEEAEAEPAESNLQRFMADVENVTFSNADLVWVGRAEADTTVGELKAANGLEVQYSAELTEEQIDAINAQTVEAGDWALISMLPFTSEESLTIVMKNGDVITIKVTDAQIKKTVISASGETFEITVDYGEDAQIPEDSRLTVREILPGDEDYDAYYAQAMEKMGATSADAAEPESEPDPEAEGQQPEAETDGEEDAPAGEPDETVTNDNNNEETGEDSAPDGISDGADAGTVEVSYARFFDIQIWHGEERIEPAADVTVSIRLLDAPEETDGLTVLHFGKEGLEILESQDEAAEGEGGETVLSFVTDEFSVYTVVKVTSFDSGVANDGPYMLVSGINDNKEYWEESWGDDYFTKFVNGMAMIDTVRDNSLRSTGVHVWDEDGQGYAGGDATQWHFESAGNGNYYIYSQDENGNRQYIVHTGNNNGNLGLTGNRNGATAFAITPNSDGTVLIHNGGWYLVNKGGGEWSTRYYQLNWEGYSVPTGDQYKFKLCKYSEDFDSFAAEKVSVQNLTPADKFIIYRKFVDEEDNETLYALAHDGTFVRVYDGGDYVYWRETDKVVEWQYQLGSDGYHVFTQAPDGSPVYLSPSISENQVLSGTDVGLTLSGKDMGEYGTTIENWNQESYDYAGLHVAIDGEGNPSLVPGSRKAGESDEFLFAITRSMPGATAETVATVDSEALGIHITMFDYGEDREYNAGDHLADMTAIVGNDEYTPHAAHALVKPYLESGVPSSTSTGAMTGLFSSGGSITYSQDGVTNLFLKSYYDENGTFRYRSEDNYAYLGKGGNTSFTVYRQAATPYTKDLAVGHSYYYHGHFMPFNDIDMTNNVSRLLDQYGNAESATDLPIGDGRTYEDIYGVQGIPNYYTGMKMEADFTMPRGGRLENGDDMIFKFTGDDDMWVYIDDVLVLDVGGIHEPLSGTINFRTGVVTNPPGSSLPERTTLKQIFMDVLNNPGTPQSVKDKISAIQWNGDTFADFSNHTFGAFYMERGAGASNLDIEFNLKVVLTDECQVEKEIPEGMDERFINQKYKFRATFKDGNGTVQPLYAGVKDNGRDICMAVYYRDRTDENGAPVSVEVDQEGYFYLRPGEAAVFKMANKDIQYNVEEVEIPAGQTHVAVNGVEQPVSEDRVAELGWASVGDRSNTVVTNYPAAQDLLITKYIEDKNHNIVDPVGNPVFEFRVYLESTQQDENGQEKTQLVPYAYGPYYLIKDEVYYTLTGPNNAPEPAGTEPVICSHTGRSGTINSIPPGYTIRIPDLAVGTHFYVEERFDNLPAGYEYVRTHLHDGTYDEATLSDIDRNLARISGDNQEFQPHAVGRIKADTDAEVDVFNKYEPFKVTVKKIWEGSVQDSAEITVTVKRYMLVDKVGNISIVEEGDKSDVIFTAEYDVYAPDGRLIGSYSNLASANAALQNLPVGRYKVVQRITSTDPATGYAISHSDDTIYVDVTDGGTATATFTNTYTPKYGYLTISKTLSGAPSGFAFNATYTVLDANGYIATDADGNPAQYSYSDIAGGKTIRLLEGSYTVEETIDVSNPAGYTGFHSAQNVSVDVRENQTQEAAFATTYGTLATVNVSVASENNATVSGGGTFHGGDTILFDIETKQNREIHGKLLI